jgi:transcriptional regulator with XRE-family HTH domain
MSRTIDPTIGKRLRYLRYRRNWTKAKLAEVSKVPIATISLVERGKRSGEGLSLETIRRLASAFEITVDALISQELEDSEYEPAAMALVGA